MSLKKIRTRQLPQVDLRRTPRRHRPGRNVKVEQRDSGRSVTSEHLTDDRLTTVRISANIDCAANGTGLLQGSGNRVHRLVAFLVAVQRANEVFVL